MDTCHDSLSIVDGFSKWPDQRRRQVLESLHAQMDNEIIDTDPDERTKHDHDQGTWSHHCEKCQTPYYGSEDSTLCKCCVGHIDPPYDEATLTSNKRGSGFYSA